MDLRRLFIFVITLIYFIDGQVLQATSLSTEELLNEYGKLPKIRDVSISPDGKHAAFIQRIDNDEVFIVVNVAENTVIGGANAKSLKARSVYFATNKHVIVVASKTMVSFRIRGKWEQSTAAVYNIETGKLTNLLKNDIGLFPAQSGLGRIVGLHAKEARVFIPAFIGSRKPAYHLTSVSLESGRARIHKKGKDSTVDWFVGANGRVLAREDYEKRKQRHVVYSYISGKAKEIYSHDTDVPDISISAISHDEKSLIFVSNHNGDEALYSMSLQDGAISGPEYSQSDRDIDQLITQRLNRKLLGLKYSGVLPEYLFFNEQMNRMHQAVEQTFPTSAVSPTSSTSDLGYTVLRVSGNEGAEDYYIYNAQAHEISRVARSYPNIASADVKDISAIRYTARDGTKIPAILTWPVEKEKRQALPLLVFPHGGPESYDRIRFDWWAQYFAQQGYLILQPNFRGSTGFGVNFMVSGRGEWGRKMQDDISDGVSALVKSGYADPSRVCIMGASYGGYAALAGGAYSADLYRCIVSVAGVSDLPKMLRDEKYYHGHNHWVVSYWQKLIGNSKSEREKLKAISPVNFANSFTAPVLLIHGKDDVVVHPRQSKRMLKALKKANKEVQYIELKGGDHWLSTSETRVSTLKAIADFLRKHNPISSPTKTQATSAGI